MHGKRFFSRNVAFKTLKASHHIKNFTKTNEEPSYFMLYSSKTAQGSLQKAVVKLKRLKK